MRTLAAFVSAVILLGSTCSLAAAGEPEPGQPLVRCWMEGASIKCERHPSPQVQATLSIEFVSFGRTVEAGIGCCGIDPLSPDLSERTDCTACDVRNITTIPGQAFPVRVTLTAVYQGQSYSSGPVEVAGENVFALESPLVVAAP